MYRPKYFSFTEMISTVSTAQENNLPDWDDINRLLDLCRWILDPVREMYGKPIVVSSGFRSPFLNRLVGGVSTSRHLQGLAADLRCDDPKALFDLIAESDLPFDQLIYYQKRKFVHVSYSPTYRHEIIVKDS
jgi:zinc D-Ala-D-Ala carboxypeptidase